MSNAKVPSFGDMGQPWNVPGDDLTRQAISPLRGYAYQLHQSAAAWISLKDDDLLHLEVAEDFSEIVREPNRLDEILRATQVKDTRESAAVTLNSADVLDAINALFRLRTSNPGRDVRLIFLTTSEIGKERKNPPPSGEAGIEAWRAAAIGDVAVIRAALLQRIEEKVLKEFIEKSTDEQLREMLVAPLTFVCGANNWQVIEAKNRNDLVALRKEVQSTAAMAHQAYENVLHYVITTILSSPTRQLNRSQLIDCLSRATSIPLPSQVVTEIIGDSAIRKADDSLDRAEITALARTLLDVGSPPSVILLFPDSDQVACSALNTAAARMRTVTESRKTNGVERRVTISELASMSELQHLFVAPPGSGKTHALWQTANQLLKADEIIPLFLPVAHLNSWNDVKSMITELAPGLSIDAILSDKRVCFCIDGWSEFATGERASEKRKALIALRNARVIANGKYTDVGDTPFKIWSLELLSPYEVADVLGSTRRGEPILPGPALDLLRFPLLLSIHVLSGAKASAPGELLRQFHDHLARDLPESFTDALAGAVAATTLAGDRSYGRLISELRDRASAKGLTDPVKLLRQLGTVVERSGYALPIHDLYWSWLIGRGLLAGSLISSAIEPLHTRESYALALESGACAKEEDVGGAIDDDLVLAAALDASRRLQERSSILVSSLERALKDDRMAVRCRAALTVLELAEPNYLRRALDVLSELTQAKLHVAEWSTALRLNVIFQHRGVIADWIGSEGSNVVLDVIAERGGPEWEPWLEQVASSGKISYIEALAAALGCYSDLPVWGRPHLDDLLGSKSWKLRVVAARRSNLALARAIASNYERLVETVIAHNSGSWIDLNRIIVSCGDDDVFQSLLGRFSSMSKRSQEFLGYAIVDRGSPWIAAFQKIAFRTPNGSHHNKLAESLSLEIDDVTARTWIAAGYGETGWRVLIARHGESILPELIAELPASFADLHHIPAVANMRFLQRAPASLITELWSRIGSPMQPKAMQDIFYALATVFPQGVASIVRFIVDQSGALPGYHLNQALRLYDEWRSKLGGSVEIRISTQDAESFERWVANQSLRRWEDHFTPMILSSLPDFAIEVVLKHLQHDEDKVVAILSVLKNVKSYHAELLNHMLAAAKIAKLIPDVFANCFDTFPVEQLRRCIDSPDVDQDTLLWRLGATSNPLHQSVHIELIRRVLKLAVNQSHYRYVASMLKSYAHSEVVALLEQTISHDDDRSIWFVRAVETTRGERLINEAGRLRKCR